MSEEAREKLKTINALRKENGSAPVLLGWLVVGI
jgi:hypothetical protein